ncbi:UspA [Sesbania bispinosa]|nr:UspA [Sesbania bispinosa]
MQHLDTDPKLPQIKIHNQSSSPSISITAPTPTASARRIIGVAVDLSDESVYVVSWAVQQYIRPDDVVILFHVSPTNVLFCADWGFVNLSINVGDDQKNSTKLEDDFAVFTASKVGDHEAVKVSYGSFTG